MDCLLTIKGDGRGKYGRFKKDTTRPIRDWIIDNQAVYSKVLKHVAQCDKCDPVEVFTEYLSRRRRLDKFKGRTTGVLCNLGVLYEKLCKKRGIVFPQALLHEVRLRSDSSKILKAYESEFSNREIYDAIKHLHKTGRLWVITDLCAVPRFQKINMLYTQISDECPADIDELLKVADVLLS